MAGPPNPAGSLALVSRSPWGEGPTDMSQISRGIFAVSLTLGAVPLALGRDLYGAQDPSGTPVTAINRAAKADRIAGVARADVPTQTISLRLNGVSDTSVLVRIPLVQAASGGASAPPWTSWCSPIAVSRSTKWQDWKRAALFWAARWRINWAAALCQCARRASCPTP